MLGRRVLNKQNAGLFRKSIFFFLNLFQLNEYSPAVLWFLALCFPFFCSTQNLFSFPSGQACCCTVFFIFHSKAWAVMLQICGRLKLTSCSNSGSCNCKLWVRPYGVLHFIAIILQFVEICFLLFFVRVKVLHVY